MPEIVPDTPFLPATALAATLEDWGPLEKAASPQTTPMHQSGHTLWKDGEQEVGVWECTPGPSYWRLETNEAVHVLAGRMTVTPDGGTPVDLGPGDSVVFPLGWTGTWDIKETLRKFYVIF